MIELGQITRSARIVIEDRNARMIGTLPVVETGLDPKAEQVYCKMTITIEIHRLHKGFWEPVPETTMTIRSWDISGVLMGFGVMLNDWLDEVLGEEEE